MIVMDIKIINANHYNVIKALSKRDLKALLRTRKESAHGLFYSICNSIVVKNKKMKYQHHIAQAIDTYIKTNDL